MQCFLDDSRSLLLTSTIFNSLRTIYATPSVSTDLVNLMDLLWVHGNTVCYSLLLSSACDLAGTVSLWNTVPSPMHVSFDLFQQVQHATSLQSHPTLCNPMIYSPSGSSVRGILQARILECMAIPFSRPYQVLTNIVHFCLPLLALQRSICLGYLLGLEWDPQRTQEPPPQPSWPTPWIRAALGAPQVCEQQE